jgi:signal transduction histidine kinase/HAMP domain-containing protein
VRLGIRAKQIAGVTATVGLFVVVLSAVYVSQLANAVLGENQKTAEVLTKQLHSRVFEITADAPDPYEALRTDPGIRSLLESTVFGPVLNGAWILDRSGLVLASDDTTKVGNPVARTPPLTELVDADVLTKLRTIYLREGSNYEVRDEVPLNDGQAVSIRVGVSTVLVRDQLSDMLQTALFTGAAALGIAVVVGVLLAQLLLKPIHVIRSGLTRLGKGEFGVTLDLPPGDEFGELGSFFNTVSQQLSADRTLLAGQKANLQSAVEHLEDAVALFDPSGQLLFSNPAMQPTLPAEAIGRALRGLLPDGHPYRTLVEETLAMRVSRGPVQVRNPVVEARPDAGDDDLLVMTHAVAGTDGGLVGVLLVARNLAHLSRMQSTLAYSRKLVALGRLTAGIAHEVKNPLNAMMIHLELLRTKIRNVPASSEPAHATVATAGTLALSRPATSPFVQGMLDHVEIIESEIRRLDEVVQGFLKFTRPEDLRLQPVRVSELFGEILPVIEPEARKNNVKVGIECPASVQSINGDAGMLRQAFLNLAINACQAMPNGGSLRLVCAPSKRNRMEVRFEDTGVGIPPENLQKIFDLYFTTKHHGTGIGLSMVYRIVQLHDGEIEAACHSVSAVSTAVS